MRSSNPVPIDQLQRDFQAAIAAADRTIEAQVVPGDLGAARRLEVYRNAVRSNWRGALQAVYPVVLKLVDAPFFNEAADRYAEVFPSTAGDLHEYGARFGDFLARYPHAESVPYLADVARLEWALHEAFHAADVKPLNMVKLAEVPTERYADVRFKLAPYVRLGTSQYPLVDIWRMHQPDEGTPSPLDFNAEGGAFLVRREHFEPIIQTIPEADLALLAGFGAGLTLAEAGDQVVSVEEIDEMWLLGALQRYVYSAVVVDFELA